MNDYIVRYYKRDNNQWQLAYSQQTNTLNTIAAIVHEDKMQARIYNAHTGEHIDTITYHTLQYDRGVDLI